MVVLKHVMESRLFDAFYDPIFVDSTKPLMKSHHAVHRPEKTSTIDPKDRYKYFRRPLRPLLTAVEPSILLEPIHHDIRSQKNDAYHVTEDEGPSHGITIGLQTVFRDSEAQTDPYSPDVIFSKPSDRYRVSEIRDLKYGSGLPISEDEATVIDTAERSMEISATLLPFTDEACLRIRKKMLHRQEVDRFRLKERRVDEMLSRRYEFFVQTMMDRDAQSTFRNQQLLQLTQENRKESVSHQNEKTEWERIKILRKTMKKARNAEQRIAKAKKDLVAELSNFGSERYAPIRYKGSVPTASIPSLPVIMSPPTARSLSTNQGDAPSKTPNNMHPLSCGAHYTMSVEELELGLYAKYTTIKETKSLLSRNRPSSKSASRRSRNQHLADLETISSLLREDPSTRSTVQGKASKLEESQPSWRKKANRAERPPTPSNTFISDEEEEQEIAVLYLQKLLTGRAVQNVMFDGKERRKHLIEELRTAFEAREKSVKIDDQDAAAIHEKRTMDEISHIKDQANEIVAGESVSGVLSKLADDLVLEEERLREEKALKVMENERLEREKLERKEKEDLEKESRFTSTVYNDVNQIHRASAATLIDSIIEDTIRSSASLEAVRGLSRSNSEVLSKYESKVDDPSINQTFIETLVASFLVPSVQQVMQQNQDYEEEKGLIHGSQKVILDAAKDALQDLPSEKEFEENEEGSS